MKMSMLALLAGFIIDALVGDPRCIPHPVVGIGKLISAAEKLVRRIFPGTKLGENIAGGVLWAVVAAVSISVPLGILWVCGKVSVWLRLAAESIMCWQIIAARSLRDESMKVYKALENGTLDEARRAVGMIVGRDTGELDDDGVTRAAVETVAENTSDGVTAPMIFMAIGGAPLGFLYKAVNTMDSMLGYVDMPYRNIGLVPAKMDDVFNYIPSRLSALVMLAAGDVLGLNRANGWKIYKRDRKNHASPNSAQTESVCAGLLGLRLGGDAYYHGQLHKKPFIGDALRGIEHEDIRRANRIMYLTAVMMLIFVVMARAFI